MSLLSLIGASTLSAYRASLLRSFYLNDPFNLGYISSTHSQTHMDFMGQDILFWRTLFWGQLSSGQHVATVPVGVYKHSLMQAGQQQTVAKLLQQNSLTNYEFPLAPIRSLLSENLQ